VDALLSRRELLEAGMWVGVGALASPLLQAASTDLITKAIPVSGEKLPVIGIGTDAFRTGDNEALRAELKRMSELGGSVIDTAAAYGDSEAIIGAALADLGIRSRMFLATKLTAGGLFGPGGQASLERSLQRLKTERIDLLQVHNLNGVDELLPLLQQWKKAGKIRYYGITTSRVEQQSEMLEYMRKYPLDFIQVDYSIGDRAAANEVLPLALERRIAVLVNLPFGRASLLAQAASRPLPPWAGELDIGSWGQFLLKYVVSHPAVTCAIPGSTKVKHLEDNQAAGRGRLPDAAMRQRMEAYWDARR
jgi:aryl-alcohol dehydrogenase-like predicted oxidoreductase